MKTIALLLIALSFACSTQKTGEGPKATTCEGVAEDFGSAIQKQDYRRAYDYTIPSYQGDVSFEAFEEKHRMLHESAGKPSKWGISEVGYFQTDVHRGVGIDFGNTEEDGEVVPLYVCILTFSEENNICRVGSVDCGLEDESEEEGEEEPESED